MKKQLLNLSLTLAAGILLASNAVAQLIPPVRTMEIPAITEVPVIDGLASEASYSAMQSTDVFNPTGWDGDADFKFDFQVMWGYNYLYVYGEIADDVEHNYVWDQGDPWTFDNCELFVDLDTNTVATAYGATCAQLRFARALDSVETAGRAPRADYMWYVENTASGWAFEVAVPWTAFLADGALPEDIMDYVANSIGFDMSGADSDNTDGDDAVGNRDVQSAWDSDEPDDEADRTEDTAWNNTSVFGNVTLMGTPVDFSPAVSADASFNVYPNPALNTVTFVGVSGTVEVFSITGQQVMVLDVVEGVATDISALNSGVYFMVANNEAQKVVVQ
jgi:hypothetical protein